MTEGKVQIMTGPDSRLSLRERLLFAERKATLLCALVLAVSLFICTTQVSAQPTPFGESPPTVADALPAGGTTSGDGAAEPGEGETIPTRNLLEVLMQGGPLMFALGICSLMLVVFVFERAISLRRGRVIPGPFVKRFLKQIADGEIDRDEALELCADNGSPTAEVFSAAVKKWGRSSVEVEQAIIDSGERVTNGLRKYLRLLNGIATISPLLGLLGTVTGMIAAFNEFGTGNPEKVIPGISQALLTTAAGLCVAIPALIAYLFFVSRVDQLIIQIDSLGQELVNSIAADGVPNPAPRRGSDSSKKKSKRSSDARGAA